MALTLYSLATEVAPHLFRAARLQGELYAYPGAPLDRQISEHYDAVSRPHTTALRLAGVDAAANMLRTAYYIADTMHELDPEATGEDPEELASLLRDAIVATR